MTQPMCRNKLRLTFWSGGWLVLYLTNQVEGHIIQLTFRLNVKREGMSALALQYTMKALADPIRRDILKLLKKGRLSAGEIGAQFPVTAASISRHLLVLKEAELIRDTREGKFIFYELNATVLEEIMLWISDLKGEDEDA